MSLQAAPRVGAGAPGPRFGLTATRKTGGAVERNRMRRRLREALRRLPEGAAQPDHDYVVVLRREALSARFEQLTAELQEALRRIHAPRGQRRGARADATSEARSNA